jgi:radical SAM-linked protein
VQSVKAVVRHHSEEVFALNKYRLKFEKKDKMIYIGHLDLMTFFQRAIKRANLPIAYSNGFNPHQQMSFAVPLALGSYGYGEYVDIELKEEVPENEILQSLNASMNKGMQIVAVRKLAEGEKTGASIVTAADYRVTLDTKISNIEDVISQLMASDTMEIERTSKRKTKVVNIRPNIYALSASNDTDKTVLNMRIATGSANNLKAELVSEYIYKHCGIDFNTYSLVIERLELLKGDSESGFSAL